MFNSPSFALFPSSTGIMPSHGNHGNRGMWDVRSTWKVRPIAHHGFQLAFESTTVSQSVSQYVGNKKLDISNCCQWQGKKACHSSLLWSSSSTHREWFCKANHPGSEFPPYIWSKCHAEFILDNKKSSSLMWHQLWWHLYRLSFLSNMPMWKSTSQHSIVSCGTLEVMAWSTPILLAVNLHPTLYLLQNKYMFQVISWYQKTNARNR